MMIITSHGGSLSACDVGPVTAPQAPWLQILTCGVHAGVVETLGKARADVNVVTGAGVGEVLAGIWQADTSTKQQVGWQTAWWDVLHSSVHGWTF